MAEGDDTSAVGDMFLPEQMDVMVQSLLTVIGTGVESDTGVERMQECFNDWGGRGYDDSVPGDGTKTTPSGDRTT